MSTEQQSVDEQSSSDTEVDDQPDIRAQQQQAQTSGEVFEGRSHGER